MMNLRHFYFNLFREHCSVVWGAERLATIVDPGCRGADELRKLTDCFASEGLTPAAILLTHAHFDHIYGVKALQDIYGIPVYMNPVEKDILSIDAEDAAKFGMEAPDISFRTSDIADGDALEIGGLRFEVITTPGHTLGSVCFYEREEATLFTGDTLFAGTIGRTDHRYADYDLEIVSIMEKLIWLDSDVKIVPGHGGCSSIGWERTHNPFLEPFNEPQEENGL